MHPLNTHLAESHAARYIARMSAAASPSTPWTVARLLAWTREYFERAKVESPRLCAEILLAHAMGCQRIALFTRYESVPDAATLDRFRENVKQAASGKPIAYLTGHKEFFALAFEVTPDVLIPRPETELLVERAITLAKQHAGGADQPPRILDLGTGSGCIAVSLAKNLPAARLFASDLSAAALAVAQRNAAKHGVAERIDFREGDLLQPWRDADSFDIIVSNPPYIGLREAPSLPSNVRDHEPHAALFAGDDGLAVLRRIVDDGPGFLAPGGQLLTEIAYNQSRAARQLLADAGWSDIVTYKDGLSHERVVHARKPAAASAQVA